MSEDRYLIPRAFQTIMGELPVIGGEDIDAYELLLGRIGVESEAKTIVDWLLAKDVADHTWQILRVRRFITILLDNNQKLGLAAAIDLMINEHPGRMIDPRANKYAYEKYTALDEDQHGKTGAERANDVVELFGLVPEEVANANAFFRNFDTIDKAEEMLARLELRREGTLREIERRRGLFGGKLRNASDAIIEADVNRLPKDKKRTEEAA